MSSRSDLKRLTEEEKCSRRYACWAQNHKGWRKPRRISEEDAHKDVFCEFVEKMKGANDD